MTQSAQIPNSTYTFPNVSFQESVVGPIPFTPRWRNNIGVVGVFSRGPAGPTTITNRQDFAYLFGEDSSPGSLFVRQAMLQGATNFQISRVMPDSKVSTGAIFFKSGVNPTNEPFIATGDARTVGLTLEASYIGSPSLVLGTALGDEVRVEPAKRVLIPNYVGVGYFDFKVIEKVDTATAVSDSMSITTSVVVGNNLQVVTSTDAGFAAAKPGFTLEGTISATAVSLKFLTYAYEQSAGVYAAIVQGACPAAGAQTLTLTSPSTSDPDYFVLSYLYRSGDGAAIANLSPARTYTTAGTANGFMTFAVTDKDYKDHAIFSTSGGLTSVNTGVRVAIGASGSSIETELVPSTKFSVPFVRAEVKIGETNTSASGFPNTASAFAAGLSGTEILADLRTAIGSNLVFNKLIDELAVQEGVIPVSLTFESTFKGREANRIVYQLTRTVGSGTPNDLQFNNGSDLYATDIAMAGGQDGMLPARRILYDVNGNPLVLIEALSPGSHGNRLRISVRPTPPGQFRLEVVDELAADYAVPIRPETYLLSNYSVDPQTGLYTETLDSKLVKVYFLPVTNANGQTVSQSVYNQTPQRLAPPIAALSSSAATDNPYHPSHKGTSYLTNIYLTGGSEPADYTLSVPAEDDYIDAIKKLEEVDCMCLSVAGITLGDARYELAISEVIAQAERSSTLNGLRVGVIAAPASMSQERARTLASGISSNRVVIVGGWNTMVGSRFFGVNNISPAGFYCGILASIPPHVSPAAISGGQPVTGVVTVDSKSSPQYLDAITRGRIELLYFDPGLKLFKFLNGITTSSDPYDRYVSVRRMQDQIIMDLYQNLQWVRSSPNTRSTRSRVATACDAYLKALNRDEMIFSYQPTICDESNNSTTDASSGRLNIRLTYTPIFPADFIKVHVIRDLSTEFSVSSAPSVAN